MATVSVRSDATSEAESPSPTGPLIDDSTLEDEVPEINDLEISNMSDVGQEGKEADKESAENKALPGPDPTDDRTLTGARGPEKGKDNEQEE